MCVYKVLKCVAIICCGFFFSSFDSFLKRVHTRLLGCKFALIEKCDSWRHKSTTQLEYLNEEPKKCARTKIDAMMAAQWTKFSCIIQEHAGSVCGISGKKKKEQHYRKQYRMKKMENYLYLHRVSKWKLSFYILYFYLPNELNVGCIKNRQRQAKWAQRNHGKWIRINGRRQWVNGKLLHDPKRKTSRWKSGFDAFSRGLNLKRKSTYIFKSFSYWCSCVGENAVTFGTYLHAYYVSVCGWAHPHTLTYTHKINNGYIA